VFTGIPAAAQPGGRPVALLLRLLVVAGVGCIAVAWSQASNTVEVSEQVDWAPLGLAGVAVISLCLLGSVLVARQAVSIRLYRLAPFIARAEEWAPAADAAAPAASPHREPLVAAARMARYHRASCPLTVGKPVRPESRHEHEIAGRQACGVCAP
jgi:hypothetical protein